MRDDPATLALSVVIATRNRRALLGSTLPTILGQDLAAADFEVIVVVDGSNDGTAGWLRAMQTPCALVVIEQDHGGPGAARNAGAAAARGELLLFLDDDVACPPHLLRMHLESHRGQACRVSFGAILPAMSASPSLAALHVAAHARKAAARLDAGVVVTDDLALDPNRSLRANLFRRAGGFDPRFGAARETAEVAWRLIAAGAQFHYLPRAAVEHVHAKGNAAFARDEALLDGANEVRLARRHPRYRPLCAFSAMARTPPLRRRLRRMASTSLFDALVALPLAICEGLRFMAWPRAIGMRLLNARRLANFWRGARECAGSWAALEREFGVALPVLIYHHVGPPRPGTFADLTVSPAVFEKHIRWLRWLGFEGVRPAQWEAWRTAAAPLPRRPVMITFDDGYADTADHAFPALQRHGHPACVFVVAGEIGGTNRWDAPHGSAPHALLGRTQLLGLGDAIEVAAHTMSHPDLRSLSPQDCRREVLGSREVLARLTGRQVTAFAYPYGYHDPASREVAGDQFPLAFTTEEGRNCLATDPRRQLRTMVMPGDGFLDLASRLHLGYSLPRVMRARLARLRRRVPRLAT
jgi:peptidoglycan/xylan/chitin deacetylase (PgdA/CDA1 family)/glycosyltransferase involved in cell wall biosynthesis